MARIVVSLGWLAICLASVAAHASEDELAPLIKKKPPPPTPPAEPPPAPVWRSAAVEAGARGGVLVAISQLGAGPEARVELSFRLGAISDRLRVSLSGGWAELTAKGPQLIPTRGYDPAVIQNIRLFPIAAALTFDLVRSGRSTVRLGLGGGPWVARTELISFSTTDSRLGVGGLGEVGLSYRLRVGPGDLALSAAFLSGALPLPLSRQNGQTGFNAFTAALSYAFHLFQEDSHQ